MKHFEIAEVSIKNNSVVVNLTKIILAVLLFFCLVRLPYGYYQFVRFIAFVGFAFLAYHNFERGCISAAFIYSILAVLFQPLFKIALGRTIWNIVDVVVGVGLILSIFLNSNKSNNRGLTV